MQLELMPNAIPNFLSASSPQGLRRAMLRNNVRLGSFVNYFGIAQVSFNNRPSWIVWFYDPVEKDKDLDVLAGESTNGRQ